MKTKKALSPQEFEELLEQAQAASDMLKAMSHESRLLIMCLLLDAELTVGEIEGSLDLPQASVSQHLARLRKDCLLATRRDGRSVYYRIADPKVIAIITTLHQQFCST